MEVATRGRHCRPSCCLRLAACGQSPPPHAAAAAAFAREPGVGASSRRASSKTICRRSPPSRRSPAAMNSTASCRISAPTASSAKSRGCMIAHDQIAAVDPATLEPRERFDREYLLAVVDKDLFWIEKTKFPFSNPALVLGQSRSGCVLEPKLRAAGRAHEGLHQVRARHSQDGDGHQGQSQVAPAQRPTWNWESRNSAGSPSSIPRTWRRSLPR